MTAISTKSFDESMADFAIEQARDNYEQDHLSLDAFLRDEVWRRFGFNMNDKSFPSVSLFKNVPSLKNIKRFVDLPKTYSNETVHGTSDLMFEPETYISALRTNTNEVYLVEFSTSKVDKIIIKNSINEQVVDDPKLKIAVIKAIIESQSGKKADRSGMFKLISRLLDVVSVEDIVKPMDVVNEIQQLYEIDPELLELQLGSFKETRKIGGIINFYTYIVTKFNTFSISINERLASGLVDCLPAFYRLSNNTSTGDRMNEYKLAGLISLIPELLERGWTKDRILEFIKNGFFFPMKKEKTIEE